MKRAPNGTKPKKGPFRIDNFSIVATKKKSRGLGDKLFPFVELSSIHIAVQEVSQSVRIRKSPPKCRRHSGRVRTILWCNAADEQNNICKQETIKERCSSLNTGWSARDVSDLPILKG